MRLVYKNGVPNLFQNGQQLLHVTVRTGNHVSRNNFAPTSSGSATGLDGGLNSADIAADHDAHQSGTDLLGTIQNNVRRLDHSTGSLDSGYQTTGFYQT